MSEPSSVVLSREGGTAVITLNRPQQFNAIDIESMQGLHRALLEIEPDAGVRAVILRGAGAAFCGGGDIRAMRDNLHDLPHFIGAIIDAFHAAILALRRLPVPVIAAVQGAAAGGGFSLALACDLVVAARSARFVVAYPKLATSTDGGLSFFLSRRIGSGRALDVLLLRNQMNTELALQWGAIDRVVDDDQLDAEAEALAAQLGALPAHSVREIKQLVGGLNDDGLAQQLAAERAGFLRCCRQPEFSERVVAFLDKKA
jgi:2-(1,2-epoxy-1,2-dihydrophenyl)acetyl-CoA isomerase